MQYSLLVSFFAMSFVLSKSLISHGSRYARAVTHMPSAFTVRCLAGKVTGIDDTVIATCTKKITDLLNPVRLKVTSSNEDPNGSHIRIECVSEEFTGKSTLQRQRLVYKAIWEELNGPVHAVDSIVAKTPKEVGL